MNRKTSEIPGLKKVKDRWRVRVTTTDPQSGRRLERQALMPLGATRLQALVRLEELHGELNERLAPRSHQRMTLEDYAVEWLAARHLAARTRVGYTAAIADHLLPHLVGQGLVYADEVRRLNVQRWVSHLETCRQPSGDTYAHATVRSWWRPARMLLQDMAADLSILDPTVRVRPPVRPHTDGAWHHETQPLSRADLDDVLDDLREHEPWYFPAILTMTWTGARESEIRTLLWDDVDLEDLTFCGRTQKTIRHGNSDRSWPMAQVVAAVLREHRQYMLQTNHPGLATGLAFPAIRGKLLARGTLRKVLIRTQDRVGISESRVRPHVLRRTLNVFLRQVNPDSAVRRAWLGHTSDRVNRLYDFVDMTEKRAALDALKV